MPAKNVVKPFVENGYYHLYNRGVGGNPIFYSEQDFDFFKKLLYKYLSSDMKVNPKTNVVNLMNLSGKVELLCFCLMPNHFHFLVKQTIQNGITLFTRRIFSSYASYLQRKYDHTGNLFQGKLRGILVDNENYLVHLSRYIHRNPVSLLQGASLREYKYSSYYSYLTNRDDLVSTGFILNFFNSSQMVLKENKYLKYSSFVEYENVESDQLIDESILDFRVGP